VTPLLKITVVDKMTVLLSDRHLEQSLVAKYYTANSDIQELCYIDKCAYGVLTLPALHVKCFSLQQVGYGGFHYDRHFLVETC